MGIPKKEKTNSLVLLVKQLPKRIREKTNYAFLGLRGEITKKNKKNNFLIFISGKIKVRDSVIIEVL